MFQIAYVSSAIQLFTEAELATLLVQARKANALLGVTGLLLYSGGNFMQALEGEEGVVTALYERIAQDRRHRGCLPLIKWHVPERDFSSWSMAYHSLDTSAIRELPGFSEFLATPLTPMYFQQQPSRLQRLLRTFKVHMR